MKSSTKKPISSFFYLVRSEKMFHFGLNKVGFLCFFGFCCLFVKAQTGVSTLDELS